MEDASVLRVLDPAEVPVTTALGVLGMPGFTAYAGLLALGKPQPGETVAVAAATGPVGSAVGQIAKVKGATAIGIAGGQKKVDLRAVRLRSALDHRGGDLQAGSERRHRTASTSTSGRGRSGLERGRAAAQHVRRVPVCGLVPVQWHVEFAPAARWARHAVRPLVADPALHPEQFVESCTTFLRDMTQWVKSGRWYQEEVIDGFDNVLDAFNDACWRGKNFGKTVVKIAGDSNETLDHRNFVADQNPSVSMSAWLRSGRGPSRTPAPDEASRALRAFSVPADGPPAQQVDLRTHAVRPLEHCSGTGPRREHDGHARGQRSHALSRPRGDVPAAHTGEDAAAIPRCGQTVEQDQVVVQPGLDEGDARQRCGVRR